MVTTEKTGYQRALDAEPALRAITAIVDALCALVRPSDRMCSGCVWEAIVKPLVVPLIGWERGMQPRQAKEGPRRQWITAAELVGEYESDLATRTKAVNDTERWMRTSNAFDSFVRELIHRLHDADPGNGHGVGHHDA